MTDYLKKTVPILLTLFLFSGNMEIYASQDVDSLLRRADSLRKAYVFGKSMRLYDQALEQTEDSVARIAIQDSKMLSENGLGMTDFVFQPTVVARHRFSTEDFYLYYPLRDSSWRPLPNILNSDAGHPFYKAIYFPEDPRETLRSRVMQTYIFPTELSLVTFTAAGTAAL